MNMRRPPLVVIAGPTASGKSAAALALAEARGGVVINADASQVYRDLRILTARPSREEEARAPHRLFGHVDAADTSYSAARWAAEARVEIAAVHAQKRLPILVGGTGLYLRTLLYGIAAVPAIDPAIRAVVRALSVAEAHAALAIEDAPAAAHLHPHDTFRVARALEVVRSTGHPLAYWQAAPANGIAHTADLAAVILLPPRDELLTRCDSRLVHMFRQEAFDEVGSLLARPDLPIDAPARRAIGVSEIAKLLGGQAVFEWAFAYTRIATHRYAKRQSTWFRNQSPPDWITVASAEDAVHQIAIKLRETWLT